MIHWLKSTWQQLRHYPQGCDFETDYKFIQSCAHMTGIN